MTFDTRSGRTVHNSRFEVSSSGHVHFPSPNEEPRSGSTFARVSQPPRVTVIDTRVPRRTADVGEGAARSADLENENTPSGVQPSPADSGNADSAEGKGRGKGEGTADGFQPSPAGGGQSSAASEVAGDGQGQVNASAS